MAAGGWKPADVARLVGRNTQTIYGWLTDAARLPGYALRILELELQVRELKSSLYRASSAKQPKPAGRVAVRMRGEIREAPSMGNPGKTNQGRNRRRG